MFKIINIYISKLFIYRFIIIFFIIFSLFIIEFFWSKLDDIIEKGVYYYSILKLLFYFGISIVPLITPLSILLACIMLYGELSEKNEILAIKSIGLSIFKVLKPILFIILIISILLYLFTEYIIPIYQKKGKILIYNISILEPYIDIKTGIFIQKIPNIIIKFDKKIDGYNNNFKGIYIRYIKNIYFQKTILAKNGFINVYNNSKLISLNLFNGIIYEEYNNFYSNKINQKYKIITFNKLIQNIKKPIYKNFVNNYGDNYSILNHNDLIKEIKILKNQINKIKNNLKYKKVFSSKEEKKLLYKKEKFLHNYQFELYNRFSFPFTCISMFFIGSYLGIITKKGGIGLPIIISLIIFILYYVILTLGKILVNIDIIHPFIGSWISNIIMFPLMIYTIYRYNLNLI